MNDKTKGEQNDSCVALYWEERKMAAQEKRAFAFSYGLGKISGDGMKKGTKLALTYNPKPTAGSEFTVTAWLKNPEQGQAVSLEVPKEFSFVEPTADTQQVSKGKSELGQVSWRAESGEGRQAGDLQDHRPLGRGQGNHRNSGAQEVRQHDLRRELVPLRRGE